MKRAGWHCLTIEDETARAATCSVCGPIRAKPNGLTTNGFRRWRCPAPDRARHNSRYAKLNSFRWRYGLSTEEAVALLAGKPSTCDICGSGGDIVYDHCHKTKGFRGWLCSACNLGIGKFADDPERLEAAARYLRNEGTR